MTLLNEAAYTSSWSLSAMTIFLDRVNPRVAEPGRGAAAGQLQQQPAPCPSIAPGLRIRHCRHLPSPGDGMRAGISAFQVAGGGPDIEVH